MLIGYARVSTLDQNLDLQTDALKRAGCERIHSDTVTGKHRHRPGLERALEDVRPGDTLIVWKLDRLGRSLKDLIEIVGELEKQGVNFQSITDNINTSTPAGKLFFHMMASLAEFERELIRERTKAGLAASRGVKRIGGRKPKMTPQKLTRARQMLGNGQSYQEVADTLKVSLTTLYRLIPAKEQ